MKTLVLSDKLANYPELCAGGRFLGGTVEAFYAGSKEDAAKIGADKVYNVVCDGSKMYEDFFETVKDLVAKEKPDVVLINASKRGKQMAARLAAAFETSALTDLGNISVEGNVVKGVQMYYGGTAVRTVKSKGLAVITLGAGSFEPDGGAAKEVVGIEAVPTASKIIRKEVRQKEGKTVNLAAAKKVVGVGRGISKQEDLALAEALAVALEAEVGCSRPISEGEGWMTPDRYIGVSGIMLKPDLYVAVGISGQIQHTIGINNARTIIAINKDKNAPIFKACDYGIVGDLYKIVPELTKLIKG